MGANAQTTVPTFTASQILTADQMNQSARTGVPVFADTTARDAGFGGTGEKTLAEGQLCYVENLTGDAQIQYYDGSTWNSLGAAGLTLIKTQTVGSAVASVTVSDVFSATYDRYLITAAGGAQSAGGANVALTLGATTTGYYFAGNYVLYNGTSGVFNGANAASWTEVCYVTANGFSCNIVLTNPFAAANTIMNAQVGGAVTTSFNASTNQNGYLANTTSYTAFTFTLNAGTVTGGTIRVYGFRN